jgi:hypothetical protein
MKPLIRCRTQLLLKYLYIVTLYSDYIVLLKEVFIRVTLKTINQVKSISILNYFGYTEKYEQI